MDPTLPAVLNSDHDFVSHSIPQSDNYWLNTRTPCLTYGLRGIAYYQIDISGPGADLHSGIYGGAVYEPMTALIALMSKLVSQDGRILIPGVYDGVKAADSEELYVRDVIQQSDELTP